MAKYNPRNRNFRHDEAPLAWSQRFYESRPEKPRNPCGFHVGEHRETGDG